MAKGRNDPVHGLAMSWASFFLEGILFYSQLPGLEPRDIIVE
jgi:hypothetical protein